MAWDFSPAYLDYHRGKFIITAICYAHDYYCM